MTTNANPSMEVANTREAPDEDPPVDEPEVGLAPALDGGPVASAPTPPVTGPLSWI